MRYPTKMTSKGTITIASPLRKALGLKPGQTVHLEFDEKNDQVVFKPEMTLEKFEKIRDEILSRYPDRPKGLSMKEMRNLATKKWLSERK